MSRLSLNAGEGGFFDLKLPPSLLHNATSLGKLSLIHIYRDGKTTVYDGRTGEKFDNRVTVGYMLSLIHI